MDILSLIPCNTSNIYVIEAEMNTIRSTSGAPIYDCSSDEGLREAKFDLVHKVCRFVAFRLKVYGSDHAAMKAHARPDNPKFTTENGYMNLFDLQPVIEYRRVCETLAIASGSLDTLWNGLRGEYTLLQAICSSSVSRPGELLIRHFLFFKAIFSYRLYVSEVLRHGSFQYFDEQREVQLFLDLFFSTQYLLDNLLEMVQTPYTTPNSVYREQLLAAWMYNYDENRGLQDKVEFWWDEYMSAHGRYLGRGLHPGPIIENGEFAHLEPISGLYSSNAQYDSVSYLPQEGLIMQPEEQGEFEEFEEYEEYL